MATWDIVKAADKACPKCGSTYEVKYRQVPMRDIDSFDCVVCGLELESWKSTRYPTYTPKVLAKWPKDDPMV
jgi:DNA-directed RNA polymerase subunit RPC12/RpoP